MNYPRQIREKIITHLFDKHGVDYVYHGGELNFRCPLCGDSQRDPNKKRGWYNLDRDVYWCFNCQESSNFDSLMMLYTNKASMKEFIIDFLKDDEKLFTELITTSGMAKTHKRIEKVPTKVTYNNFLLSDCVLISHAETLPWYVKKWMARNMLVDTNYPFYYCKNVDTRFYDRTIIPFFDRQGDCVYIQARAMHDESEKYINPYGPKNAIFGENAVDLDKDIPVLEGPIKSLFVENAVATMTCSISNFQMTRFKEMEVDKQLIIMFDNDEAGLAASEKYAMQGFKVFIYPNNWPMGLDPDEYCIKKGIAKLSLSFVQEHSYEDVAAITLLKLKN